MRHETRNVLFISIDSLARHWLTPYGRGVELPVEVANLERLAARGTQFERHWAGSLPCMPARREFLAGVIDFLWRPWGPLEAYDEPIARVVRRSGVRTALITDHYHYWHFGSGGYHEDFHTWEFIRGHEFDAYRTGPSVPDRVMLRQLLAGDHEEAGFANRWQYARNVHGFEAEEDFFAPRVFSRASQAVRDLAERGEPWFLYVDSFDVHEPFHSPEPYASAFTDEDPRNPDLIVWPQYGKAAALDKRQLAFLRSQFAAKVAMVDRWLERLLDVVDELDLWSTTTLILTSDHGHFLGEHGYVGKPLEAPLFDTLARTPLWIAHPGSDGGQKVHVLTTAVDIYATILEALGCTCDSPHSQSLLGLVRGDKRNHRDIALYGVFGGAVNATDGRFTLLTPPDPGGSATCYSTRFLGAYRPTHWSEPPVVPKTVDAGQFLPYNDAWVWRYDGGAHRQGERVMFFDTDRDPDQTRDLGGCGHPDESRVRALSITELERLGFADTLPA